MNGSFLKWGVILVLVSRLGLATLGGLETTVEKDRQGISGVHRRSLAHNRYRVEEFSNSAITVREYLATDGRIFAVSWNGHGNPNIGALLGDYASDFETATKRLAQTKRRIRMPFRVIKGDRVVVKTSGHLHALRGLAYAPELLPSEVSIDELY